MRCVFEGAVGGRYKDVGFLGVQEARGSGRMATEFGRCIVSQVGGVADQRHWRNIGDDGGHEELFGGGREWDTR